MKDSMKKKVAVIGSGISGISSAWFLSQGHDVTLFEKNDYVGGHTHTVDITFGNNLPSQAVDTGFIVYNEPNYPLLTKMFEHLILQPNMQAWEICPPRSEFSSRM